MQQGAFCNGTPFGSLTHIRSVLEMECKSCIEQTGDAVLQTNSSAGGYFPRLASLGLERIELAGRMASNVALAKVMLSNAR